MNDTSALQRKRKIDEDQNSEPDKDLNGKHIVDKYCSINETLLNGTRNFKLKVKELKVSMSTTNFKLGKNYLPLASIKRIMRIEKPIRISSETLQLFAKACELFVLELAIKSFAFTTQGKRRTIQKSDIVCVVSKLDYMDFIYDSCDKKIKEALETHLSELIDLSSREVINFQSKQNFNSEKSNDLKHRGSNETKCSTSNNLPMVGQSESILKLYADFYNKFSEFNK